MSADLQPRPAATPGRGPGAAERLHDAALFLRRGVRHPQQVCSIFPSSPGVGRAMARAIAGRPVEAVVELGGGTGPVTRALIESGIAAGDLTSVELDPELARHLCALFPDVEVLNKPAQRLAAMWREERRDKVGAVVSTLPLRIFDAGTVDAVLGSAFEILAPGGRFVQFTYRFASPVAHAAVERLGLVARRAEIVWLNLPPAAIWVYSRAL
jgi:phosphatidylethanolamine/phosphatidyl-N-methylethanolamine N-methyltransferase